MALKVNNVIYRSLEDQVRKNMEDISTESESLAALTNKVDNLQLGGEKISITLPAGASSGTITDAQLAKLQENEANYIEMVNDKELYYLNDSGHVDGYLTYSHVGIENSKATIKTLTIAVSTKSFVIVTTVVPTESGGGWKLYRHHISIIKSNTYDLIINILSSRSTEYTSTTNDLVEISGCPMVDSNTFYKDNKLYIVADINAIIDSGIIQVNYFGIATDSFSKMSEYIPLSDFTEGTLQFNDTATEL